MDRHRVIAEESSAQVQLLSAAALDAEGIVAGREPRGVRPLLLAMSDNGGPMISHATREFFAALAIAQRLGRPGTPGDQAWIESLFGHVKADWPHLKQLTEPAVVTLELDRVRHEYNTVRLHAGIGYVTPDDEHQGRGDTIRDARRRGLERARQQRHEYHRRHHINPEEQVDDLDHFRPTLAEDSEAPPSGLTCPRCPPLSGGRHAASGPPHVSSGPDRARAIRRTMDFDDKAERCSMGCHPPQPHRPDRPNRSG